MRKASVSIIIPALNAERHLPRCLQSVFGLDEADGLAEILVMDNGSTDRTMDIARRAGVQVYPFPGLKVGALRNRGVQFATGEFLAFIDADMELSRNWLRETLASFQDPNVVACGCSPSIPDQATWVQRAWEAHHWQETHDPRPQKVSWLPSCNVVVRREAFHAVGGFDEALVTTEDVDLSYRLSRHGTILQNPKMKAIHWGGDPDLATFWRKEVWRGLGNLRGVFNHGVRLDELPSLGYPLYMVAALLGVVMSGIIDARLGRLFLTPWMAAGLVIPPSLLALRASVRRTEFGVFPSLFLLYFVYGLARAYAMGKALAKRDEGKSASAEIA